MKNNTCRKMKWFISLMENLVYINSTIDNTSMLKTPSLEIEGGFLIINPTKEEIEKAVMDRSQDYPTNSVFQSNYNDFGSSVSLQINTY